MYWYEASEWIKGIPLSRYIASYYIGGGKPIFQMAKAWLQQLEINGDKLTEEQVTTIATCIVEGKLELEEDVNRFLHVLQLRNLDDILEES